ncbi:MAG: hypothetical protein AAGC91_11035 [Pseudomonadota bacterium]
MPRLSELLISCSDITQTARFFEHSLGLDAAAIRNSPSPLPSCDYPIAREQPVFSHADPDSKNWQPILHLVEFSTPGMPVRAGASSHDSCAKTVNFLCRDLPQVYEKLAARGVVFRSRWVEYEKAGVSYCDVHAIGPDELNIGFLEIVDGQYTVNQLGIGPIAAVCFTVPEMEPVDALVEGIGMPLVLDEHFAGPSMETMLNLPVGASLHMRLYGAIEAWGRLEIVSYNGVTTSNLHRSTLPPGTGLLTARIAVDDLDHSLRLLDQRESRGIVYSRGVRSGQVLGESARIAEVATDFGLSLELIERPGHPGG